MKLLREEILHVSVFDDIVSQQDRWNSSQRRVEKSSLAALLLSHFVGSFSMFEDIFFLLRLYH